MRPLSTALFVAVGLGSGLWPSPILAQDADRQVAQGQAIYARRCAKCHGAGGEGKMGPNLIGANHHLSGYGTADVLFDYTQQVMPADRPGRMLEVEYWAVAGLYPPGRERPSALRHHLGRRDCPADPDRSVSAQGALYRPGHGRSAAWGDAAAGDGKLAGRGTAREEAIA
jgi:Cytochrome C oxidase, cbb3-type, subunit III